MGSCEVKNFVMGCNLLSNYVLLLHIPPQKEFKVSKKGERKHFCSILHCLFSIEYYTYFWKQIIYAVSIVT
jgi:hypothetical protein